MNTLVALAIGAVFGAAATAIVFRVRYRGLTEEWRWMDRRNRISAEFAERLADQLADRRPTT